MNAIALFAGNTSPSIEDTIRIDGAPFDLTGSTVRFQMRPDGAATLAVDAAAVIVNAALGEVRYDWQAGDTATVGGYRAWWRVTLPSGGIQDTPEFDVEVLEHAQTVRSRDLCTLLDVVERVPGYEIGSDPETDATLSALITQESRDFVEACGREIIQKAAGPRTFDLTASIIDRRQLPIGDAATVTQIELFDYDDATSLGVIASSLYVTLPRIRDDWEPIRRIWFPWRPGTAALLLAPGRSLHISATWGFREIPRTVTFAVATLVIFRYLNDVASAGTQLADAANRPEFNLAASLRAALDVRDRLNAGPFA